MPQACQFSTLHPSLISVFLEYAPSRSVCSQLPFPSRGAELLKMLAHKRGIKGGRRALTSPNEGQDASFFYFRFLPWVGFEFSVPGWYIDLMTIAFPQNYTGPVTHKCLSTLWGLSTHTLSVKLVWLLSIRLCRKLNSFLNTIFSFGQVTPNLDC